MPASIDILLIWLLIQLEFSRNISWKLLSNKCKYWQNKYIFLTHRFVIMNSNIFFLNNQENFLKHSNHSSSHKKSVSNVILNFICFAIKQTFQYYNKMLQKKNIILAILTQQTMKEKEDGVIGKIRNNYNKNDQINNSNNLFH